MYCSRRWGPCVVCLCASRSRAARGTWMLERADNGWYSRLHGRNHAAPAIASRCRRGSLLLRHGAWRTVDAVQARRSCVHGGAAAHKRIKKQHSATMPGPARHYARPQHQDQRAFIKCRGIASGCSHVAVPPRIGLIYIGVQPAGAGRHARMLQSPRDLDYFILECSLQGAGRHARRFSCCFHRPFRHPPPARLVSDTLFCFLLIFYFIYFSF